MIYNKRSRFTFGQYKNYPVWAVACYRASYIEWCLTEVSDFCLDDLDEVADLKLIENPDLARRYDQSDFYNVLEGGPKFHNNPDLWKPDFEGTYLLYQWLDAKGYNFYMKCLYPFLNQKYTYSPDAIEENEHKLALSIKNRPFIHGRFER